MKDPAPEDLNNNSIHDDAADPENKESDLDNIDKLSEIKPRDEGSFQKEPSLKADLQSNHSANKSEESNHENQDNEVAKEDPEVQQEISDDKAEEDKPVVQIKTESELLHPIYQLKLKMDEKNVNAQELVDSHICQDLEDQQDIDIKTISQNLKIFMEYSKPEEIEDLTLFLSQGEGKVSKDLLLHAITTKIGFKKLNDSEGKTHSAYIIEVLKIKEILERWIETFEAAIELEEDYDNNFDLNGLNQALKNTDVELDSYQYEYLIWIYFQTTKDVRKLKRVSLKVQKKNPSLSSIKEEKEESYNEKHSAKVEDDKQLPNEIFSDRENDEYTGFADASELKQVVSFNPTTEEIPTVNDRPKSVKSLKQQDTIEEGNFLFLLYWYIILSRYYKRR